MARLNRADVVSEAKRLSRAHDIVLSDSIDAESGETVYGLRSIQRNYKGKFELPWMPRKVAAEYAVLVRRARSNWLKLVVQVQAQRLKVDGFRSSADSEADEAAYFRWQANGMDAAQNKVYRGSLALGAAYVSVWPDAGAPAPRIAGDSALVMYGEPDDSDPRRLGLALKRWSTAKGQVAALYDDEVAWMLRRDRTAGWVIVDEKGHGLGRTPVVWFPNDADLEGGCGSEIEQLIPIQYRINETLLDRLMAQKFSAFRQKWVTGLAIPEDENGNQLEPFQAGIDRLLMGEEPDIKFGEFSATDLKPYIEAVSDDVRQMAAIAQVPPQSLLGDLANLSSDALVAAESGLKFRIGDKQADFGEAWEDVMRLAAKADGDETGANDVQSQVIWRDTEAQSKTAMQDGLQKMSTWNVPMEFLLEEYGLTPPTIKRVMDMARKEALLKAQVQAAAFGVDAAGMGVEPDSTPSPDPATD